MTNAIEINGQPVTTQTSSLNVVSKIENDDEGAAEQEKVAIRRK
ncbi:hypothetical protein [Nesterenkonia sedimenti]|nr:hypothetical protein [Nesterenkonia sedimenti]